MARIVSADHMKRQRYASASVLGRVGNRKNWNAVVQFRRRKARWRNMSFVVYVYKSQLHVRGYSESKTNVPHGCPVLYKLLVYPKSDKQINHNPMELV